MEETPKLGTSIRNQEPSRVCNKRDGHGTSETVEDQAKCKHGTLTLDGGNSSGGTRLMELSRTSSRPTEDLMSLEEEIEKATTSESTEEMELQPRSGSSSIRTRLSRSRLKA
jgi:hypothetical protein